MPPHTPPPARTPLMNRDANHSDPMGSRKRVEIVSIQYLRGIAALGVVLAHASISLLDPRALIPLGIGKAGVDIFFVISGFIMYFTTVNRNTKISHFYLRRFVRIFPLYFAVSTLAFLIARFAPQLTHTFSPYLLDYLRSICFIPYYHVLGSLKPLIRPEVGQGWTLNYEVFFYILFGLCLSLPQRFRLGCLIAAGITLSLAGLLLRPTGAVLQTYTDSLILEFVLGVILGYLFVSGPAKSVLMTGAILLAGACFGSVTCQILSIPLPRVLSFGLPAATLVGGLLWLERAGHLRPNRTLLLLGDASYSLYLTHGFVLAILRREWESHFNVNLIRTHAAFIVASVLIAELVGIMAFQWMEKPVTNSLTSVLRRNGLLPDVKLRKTVPDVTTAQ